jgi:hypothetical protein
MVASTSYRISLLLLMLVVSAVSAAHPPVSLVTRLQQSTGLVMSLVCCCISFVYRCCPTPQRNLAYFVIQRWQPPLRIASEDEIETETETDLHLHTYTLSINHSRSSYCWFRAFQQPFCLACRLGWFVPFRSLPVASWLLCWKSSSATCCMSNTPLGRASSKCSSRRSIVATMMSTITNTSTSTRTVPSSTSLRCSRTSSNSNSHCSTSPCLLQITCFFQCLSTTTSPNRRSLVQR